MTGVETRTLLFSDIEGSTRLAAASGDAYADILATHRKLIREATAKHNGTEQSTEGDGFFLLFRSAGDGLAAAVDAQRALAGHAWAEGMEVRVRMGLHVGEITWSDDDVVGLAIHEAARIMGAAHSGQVLVSSVIRDLTTGACPVDVTVRSLGPHRLKDFDDPIELVQICHPEMLADFPPPRTKAVVVNLPIPRTSFVGREQEVTNVLALLASGRHVTLTGVGGSGKTRLALEVAVLDTDNHADGLFFVDLAPLADPALVLNAVAGALDAQGDPSDLEAMVLTYLRDRRVLIVLDNCEHLIDACADVVDVILSGCASVCFLATSREALQIQGEQTFSVPSLGVDDDTSEGVQLFVSRARAVLAEFTLTNANRSDVVAICRRLDGIPLAIELAAGRVDHLSVADIANRLDERFELLVGGRRRRAQRQQTLQAAMDWSWELLTSDEKSMLRRMSVFAGPFPLEAAQDVCNVDPTLELIGSLVSKSLVTMDQSKDTTRYRLLETVRLYAQEQLVEAGEAVDRRNAHRDWYLARTEELEVDDFLQPGDVNQLIADHDNVRAAMDWSAGQDRPDLLARQMVPTSFAWAHSPALFDETKRSLLQIGEDERLPAPMRADALAALAFVGMNSGDIASIRHGAERSIALDESDRPLHALALWGMWRSDEAIAVAVRTGRPGFARWCRAFAASPRIAFDPRGTLAELEELALELDPGKDGWDRIFTFMGIVVACLILDEPSRALEGVASVRSVLLRYDVASFGSVKRYPDVLEALVLGHLGRFDEGRSVLRDATRTVLREGYPLMGNDCLIALAYITAREGDPARAATLLEPVATDGAVRAAPMFSLLWWFLGELHRELAGVELDPPLPTVEATIGKGTLPWTPDPETTARIEEKLVEFAGGG